MAGSPHSRPCIVDENGNPVPEIPRSTATTLYHYKTRIVDRMPIANRPRSKSTLERLKEMLNNPEELLRVPADIIKTSRLRPVSWGSAPKGEGRYYYVDYHWRTVQRTVVKMPLPPKPGKFTGVGKVVRDKDFMANAAERLNNAAMFARIGSRGSPGTSGTASRSCRPSSRTGASGGSMVLGSSISGGPLG